MSTLSLSEAPVLELVEETKLYSLLPGSRAEDRFEASGVCVKGNHFYVVFEDTPHIARLHCSLTAGHRDNILFRQLAEKEGYEDITYLNEGRRFLFLTEPKKHADGSLKPEISQFTTDLQFLDEDWMDYPMDGRDKGLEGFTLVNRGGEEYVLSICEGYKCQGGRKGRAPGGGRIQIFQSVGMIWAHKGTIKLPKDLLFENFAGITVKGNRMAVVSQVSSAVWVGQLQEDGWGLVDEGQVYIFPKSKRGNTVYCNTEGIDWINENKLVFVSDRKKPGQNKRCSKKEQSIHIFRIPESG